MALDKNTLGLAAEFAVASELCRRNIYAQLTLGTRKRTDLLVETGRAMLRIQVKGKQGIEWPACKGIKGKEMILVFVDFHNKKETERPDFYILMEQDWKRFVKNTIKPMMWPGDQIIEGYIPKWKDGYIGTGIKPHMIREHLEKWDKIKRKLKSRW